jgi:hypothetical protein
MPNTMMFGGYNFDAATQQQRDVSDLQSHLHQRHVSVFVGQQRSRREHDSGHPHGALLFDPEPVWGSPG